VSRLGDGDWCHGRAGPHGLAALGGAALTGVGGRLLRRYRRDLDDARARLAAVDRQVIPTEFGALEYAECGAGEPVLVSHGIFHGCDGALPSVRGLVTDRRVIAPSRFGYLGSPVPIKATPADQADTFVSLLDRLGVGRIDVLSSSAGTTSALQLALRHPDRVKHLVIMSGNLPGTPMAAAPPRWARQLYRDPVMWALKVVNRPMLTRLMGGPNGFPHGAVQAKFASEMLDSIFPVAPEQTALSSTPSSPTPRSIATTWKRWAYRHCSSTRRTTP
jgi:pimeloyl-ACP methyl ester carboxylesterase